MKHLKTFESKNNNQPKVNDYVIVEYKNEILPTIAKITYIVQSKKTKRYDIFPYLIEFDNDFNFYDYGITDKEIAIEKEEVIYFSKNKKDCELFLVAHQYNL